MYKIKTFCRCLAQVFISRFFSVRSIVLLVIFLILTYMNVSQVKIICQQYDCSVSPWLLPFLMSSPYYLLTILLGILYFFSNVPFMQYTEMWKVIRLGRAKWTSIQIAYIILSSFAIMLLLYIFSVISIIPYINFEQNWGKVIHTIALTDVGWEVGLPIDISYDILVTYSGPQATFIIILIGGLVFSFIGLLMYTISIYFSRIIAVLVGGIVAISHLLVDNLKQLPALSLFSPSTWLRLTRLSTSIGIAEKGMLAQRLPTIIFVVSVSILLIIVCTISIFIKIKSYDFIWVWEEQ